MAVVPTPDAMFAMTRLKIMGKHMMPLLNADTCLIAWNQIGTQYTRMKNEPPKQKANHVAEATDRCETIRKGTVALSPIFHWRYSQTSVKTPKMTRHRMMRQEPQGYLDPPHWRARRHTTISMIKMAVPGKSNCIALVGKNGTDASAFRGGEWKKKKMTANATPPIGRLM